MNPSSCTHNIQKSNDDNNNMIKAVMFGNSASGRSSRRPETGKWCFDRSTADPGESDLPDAVGGGRDARRRVHAAARSVRVAACGSQVYPFGVLVAGRERNGGTPRTEQDAKSGGLLSAKRSAEFNVPVRVNRCFGGIGIGDGRFLQERKNPACSNPETFAFSHASTTSEFDGANMSKLRLNSEL